MLLLILKIRNIFFQGLFKKNSYWSLCVTLTFTWWDPVLLDSILREHFKTFLFICAQYSWRIRFALFSRQLKKQQPAMT